MNEINIADEILGTMEQMKILESQGIEATIDALNKHFPYRNIGCRGLVCKHCGSKRMWIVEWDEFKHDLKIDVDTYRCIDCDKISEFYYDCISAVYEDSWEASAAFERDAEERDLACQLAYMNE